MTTTRRNEKPSRLRVRHNRPLDCEGEFEIIDWMTWGPMGLADLSTKGNSP